DRDPRATLEQSTRLLEPDVPAADDDAVAPGQIEAGHVVARLRHGAPRSRRPSDADRMETGAGAVEPDGQLETFDTDAEEVRAGPGCLDLDLLERFALERGERAGDVTRARGELLAPRQLPIGLQRGLFSLGTVETADAPGREPELDDLLECLRVVFAELSLLDRGDEIGEPASSLGVLHERQNGLRLAQGDLGRRRVEPQRRASHRHPFRGSREARARSRRSRSSSGCRTPSARSTPTTSGRRDPARPDESRACTGR